MSYKYLLDIALILLSTKLLGLITRKFNLPQVVGALLAGVILGPSVLNVLKEILSSLYCQLGLTDDILRLSQVIDELIYQEMK